MTTSTASPQSAIRNPKSTFTHLRTLVVIGNGMVGHRFCERLNSLDANCFYKIVTFCEEPRVAYDRVNLTGYLGGKTGDELSLTNPEWYRERGCDLHIGERAVGIDRERRIVFSNKGRAISYDHVVLATGSAPFVPPLDGINKRGVFVYRTIEDLDAIREYCLGKQRVAVMGGGLLGLEAARAVQALGLETHVLEFAPRLMPRQLDGPAAEILAEKISALGVHLHIGTQTRRIEGNDRVERLRFEDDNALEVDALIVSAGIRPRDELARACGVQVGERGGVVVNDTLATSDPRIFAIGEVALHRGMIYGLVAPGYVMAETLAAHLTGGKVAFNGADLSAKLKLLGVEVASFGDAFADGDVTRHLVYRDTHKGIYKRVNLCRETGRVLGGMLVGDASDYARLLHYALSGEKPEGDPSALIVPPGSNGAGSNGDLPDAMQICQCNNVSKGAIRKAIIEEDLTTLGQIKKRTLAGTGCGGCVTLVTTILNEELKRMGRSVKRDLCEHFPLSRQDLFAVVKVKGIRTFDDAIKTCGRGDGCEVCKPAVASILASLWNENVFEKNTIQDTNDRFLANIQRGGTYSVIPRVPGGEITPDKLIALGTIAKKFGLYTKITGGQRVDLLGARVEQLPSIWEELIAAGFESGHAYGKALRTVKSCVGWTWCRYGVQDSTSMAIRVENRYKGIRAPHKIKAAVSGCTRECAEAQGKDFGLIATEKGWNLYVCGNGGMKPRHADLLASDLDDETAIKYIDRFLMYYIHTADRLTRTSVWLESLEGGIEHLREVIIEDKLGIRAELERDIERLITNYKCEWKEAVENPAQRAQFRHFANSEEPDPNVRFIPERDQHRPADWPDAGTNGAMEVGQAPCLPFSQSSAVEVEGQAGRLNHSTTWFRACRVEMVPNNGGIAVKYGDTQIAIFQFASRNEWFATQNMCPHKRDMVLARGLLGDSAGIPKVACPVHKKLFRLDSGACISGEDYRLEVFPVKIEDDYVYVELPSKFESATRDLCAATAQ